MVAFWKLDRAWALPYHHSVHHWEFILIFIDLRDVLLKYPMNKQCSQLQSLINNNIVFFFQRKINFSAANNLNTVMNTSM